MTCDNMLEIPSADTIKTLNYENKKKQKVFIHFATNFIHTWLIRVSSKTNFSINIFITFKKVLFNFFWKKFLAKFSQPHLMQSCF